MAKFSKHVYFMVSKIMKEMKPEQGNEDVWGALVDDFANVFAKDNKNFNKELFLKNCGKSTANDGGKHGEESNQEKDHGKSQAVSSGSG